MEPLILTPDEFADKMLSIREKYTHSVADGHRAADNIMLYLLESLGYSKGVDIFEDMNK
jgi:hypothetical protein